VSAPASSGASPAPAEVEALRHELQRHERWFVLTGAGCSTESGIPAYRDALGAWQHKQPIQFRDFVRSEAVRQRYWARSFVGFERVRSARPNAAHLALRRLQSLNRQRALVTQNVDGLHQKAGSEGVIDLHGQLAGVECLGCRAVLDRASLQTVLLDLNPSLFNHGVSAAAPDGDADIEELGASQLRVPACSVCGGVLKPAVVFFGETVPPSRISAAYQALDESEALLVVGSSLMVFSGYRFVRRAAESKKPIVVVNQGLTRADPYARLKFQSPCGLLLEAAVGGLEESSPH
jgi:NAD-dependent SIR2 family protein deacetylase